MASTLFDIRNLDIRDGLITCLYKEVISEEDADMGESLLQIEYKRGSGDYIVDLGFYARAENESFFATYLIANLDWETPLFKNATKLFSEVQSSVQDIILKVPAT